MRSSSKWRMDGVTRMTVRNGLILGHLAVPAAEEDARDDSQIKLLRRGTALDRFPVFFFSVFRRIGTFCKKLSKRAAPDLPPGGGQARFMYP